MIWILFVTCAVDSWTEKLWHPAQTWRPEESEAVCKIDARDIRQIKPGNCDAWCVRGEK